MDSPTDTFASLRPTARRPLLGLTVLLVEDSRYASDALRLICVRSGARLRRADCLRSARRHLSVYRPCVAIIDMGLPDGSGAELIAELAAAVPRVPVLLGISGDPAAEAAARDAGVDGFLGKPLDGVAAIQAQILAHLPADRRPTGPRHADAGRVDPDPLAYFDDIAHAATVLGAAPDRGRTDYAARFLLGVARSAGDTRLAERAARLVDAEARGEPVEEMRRGLSALVAERMRDAVPV
ncbi:KDP operon transcriptional regulatory protein KdpE [Roseivivax jejudonensis]|uniref:KDP operon transcriptional regulatory protein KdpE n=1 Tax=Roseivivax jejudonensis TaxID=1529041 RepID=A0A1X6YJI8_9RHOB|nr:response regulator [Roseivivax jejudonensis]SLN22991.1 KDP operon transcriptional regulatory protein KdpE [Roseivivax jejudonensis]